jgi:hypothetical protein
VLAAAWKTVWFFTFKSRKALIERLQSELSHPGVKFYPRFSGRAALTEIVKKATVQKGQKTVLVPDYICNVVVKAIKAGGAQPEYYPLLENLEPDEKFVARRVEKGDCAVLLTASLYGADGGCGWLENPIWCKRLLSTSTIFVADLCQDVFRARSLAKSLPGTNGTILVSFNNKSFPGMLGGGFLAEEKSKWSTEPDACLSTPQRIRLMRRYMLKFLGAWRRRIRKWFKQPLPLSPLPPVHADCIDFPFAFEAYKAEKEQLAAACAGLSLSARLGRLRSKRLAYLRNVVLITPGLERAPYVVLGESWVGHARQHHPYALDDDPECSIRPDLIIIHNKGFYDD